MKKKMSFFRQLYQANYAFARENSRGTHKDAIQGKGPSERV